MESDLGARHFKYPGRGWYYSYRQNPEWINYGLLGILYVLILALFITVFSGSTASNISQPVSKAEVDDFKNKVLELSSKMDQLHTSIKQKSCESGWVQFEGSCYYISSVKTDWMTARSFCQNKGADLAVITSEKEQIFLSTKSVAGLFRRYWIGLHDTNDEGKWKWVDGTNYETSYKFWKKGEPNDHEDNEDCAHIWTAGEWNDVHCTFEECSALCEKKL